MGIKTRHRQQNNPHKATFLHCPLLPPSRPIVLLKTLVYIWAAQCSVRTSSLSSSCELGGKASSLLYPRPSELNPWAQEHVLTRQFLEMLHIGGALTFIACLVRAFDPFLYPSGLAPAPRSSQAMALIGLKNDFLATKSNRNFTP